MIDETLQNEAALYAAGALTAAQREQFELMLVFHGELRAFVSGLEDGAVALALGELPRQAITVPARLKSRILESVVGRAQERRSPALVVTGPDGLVHWINPAFTQMCGYSIEELQGRKLGPILQGEKTQKDAARRMREAVHAARPCRETLINYHKSGDPYLVEIQITPIFSLEGELRWMIGEEREVAEVA